jgi:hypothetical protein
MPSVAQAESTRLGNLSIRFYTGPEFYFSMTYGNSEIPKFGSWNPIDPEKQRK